MKTPLFLILLALSSTVFGSDSNLSVFTQTKWFTTNGRGQPARLCTNDEIQVIKEQALRESLADCVASGVSTCLQEPMVDVTNAIYEDRDCAAVTPYGICTAIATTQGSSRKDFTSTLTAGKEFKTQSKDIRRSVIDLCDDKDYPKLIASTLVNAKADCVAEGTALENCVTTYAHAITETRYDKRGNSTYVCVAYARVRSYR